MKYALLPLALLALAACNDRAADGPTETTEASYPLPDRNIEPVEGPATALGNTLDAVNSYGGDLTALPLSAAVSTIDTWIDGLAPDGIDKYNADPGNPDPSDKTTAVTANLRELREALSEDDVNGPLAGVLLLTLAEDSRRAAPGSTGVDALANALAAAGEKLLGETVTGTSLPSQTLRAVAGKMGDITTLPAGAAVANVDAWIGELGGVDGTDDLVRGLRDLRSELTASSIDGEKVSGILFGLAEETSDLAGGNEAVETIAYALEAGGWRLKGKS